jgi:hypothetical protein
MSVVDDFHQVAALYSALSLIMSRSSRMLSLDLTDPGGDVSVLCEFRARLVDGGAGPLLLDAMLSLLKLRGLLKMRGRQRTDSTHVLAAIAINVVRLDAWLTDRPLAKTRRSAFASLALMAE